ncbi:hypothetical protein GCM10020369_22400 [Cryptosporangium minutisporangium]|uniref:Uncharacterized protein n=1 Tax=Cryptosporangium minutisporangium TaxID=113569 RepID=A0ABP6SVK9_9ACTN
MQLLTLTREGAPDHPGDLCGVPFGCEAGRTRRDDDHLDSLQLSWAVRESVTDCGASGRDTRPKVLTVLRTARAH